MIQRISAIDRNGIETELVSNIQLQFGMTSWSTYTYQKGASSMDDRLEISKLRFQILNSSLNQGSNTIRSLYIAYYNNLPTSPNNNPSMVLLHLTDPSGIYGPGTYDSEPINLSCGPGVTPINIGIFYRDTVGG